LYLIEAFAGAVGVEWEGSSVPGGGVSKAKRGDVLVIVESFQRATDYPDYRLIWILHKVLRIDKVQRSAIERLRTRGQVRSRVVDS